MYYEFSSQIMRNNITKNAFHHSTILESQNYYIKLYQGLKVFANTQFTKNVPDHTHSMMQIKKLNNLVILTVF